MSDANRPSKPFSPAALSRLIEQAVVAGTHSRRNVGLCHACRKWVDSFWHVNGRVRLCRDCSPKD